MQALGILIVAAVVFFLCWVVDKLFSRLFRSKAQQRSGMAVRANKRYGVFGVILSVLGILGIVAGIRDHRAAHGRGPGHPLPQLRYFL